MIIQGIYNLLGDELKEIEEILLSEINSNERIIKDVGDYILGRGGKRFRPLLHLISAKFCGYRGKNHIPLACAIEFIHTATLLHDDVVDNASLRRGSPSSNILWGNHASVLVGDYLLARSFSLLVEIGNIKVLDLLSEITTRMAEGQAFEFYRCGDTSLSESDYLRLIKDKTALLISASARAGAILDGSDPNDEKALGEFGLNLGYAFQLVDDALDYMAQEEELGKTIGKDFTEGKITLPLIFTLANSGSEDRAKILDILSANLKDRDGILKVIEIVKDNGGIEYTLSKAKDFLKRAEESLDHYPPSQEKDALLTLANYVLERRR